jgi:signal transduction histidine kinase
MELVERIKVDKNAILEPEDGTQNEKGHGVGLMLCKRLITMNGGQLDIQSMPGKGSDFYVLLPVVSVQ